MILKDNIYTSRGEGLLEGREMGRKEGMREGIREGMKKGMEKGMKKGMEKAKIQIVKNLMLAGADVKFVMEVTGMTREEILNLRI